MPERLPRHGHAERGPATATLPREVASVRFDELLRDRDRDSERERTSFEGSASNGLEAARRASGRLRRFVDRDGDAVVVTAKVDRHLCDALLRDDVDEVRDDRLEVHGIPEPADRSLLGEANDGRTERVVEAERRSPHDLAHLAMLQRQDQGFVRRNAGVEETVRQRSEPLRRCRELGAAVGQPWPRHFVRRVVEACLDEVQADGEPLERTAERVAEHRDDGMTRRLGVPLSDLRPAQREERRRAFGGAVGERVGKWPSADGAPERQLDAKRRRLSIDEPRRAFPPGHSAELDLAPWLDVDGGGANRHVLDDDVERAPVRNERDQPSRDREQVVIIADGHRVYLRQRAAVRQPATMRVEIAVALIHASRLVAPVSRTIASPLCPRPRRVLVIDDQPEIGDLFQFLLAPHNVKFDFFTDPALALEHLGRGSFDAVLADLVMPRLDGAQLCERARGTRPDVPVIIFSAEACIATVREAMHAGAIDFLPKPLTRPAVATALTRAFARRDATPLSRVGVAVEATLTPGSPAMQRLADVFDRMAVSDASVLVRGETGVGKAELVRAIHDRSARASRPFVVVDCAALTETVVDAELFGHVRGAYTGAGAERRGLIAAADGGTLFFAGVDLLAAGVQAKLLRVLDDRRVRPLGSDTSSEVDFRIMASGAASLTADTATFRRDLFYRLATFAVDVPPLRERTEEIPDIVRRVLAEHGAPVLDKESLVSDDAMLALREYAWPGNRRELENAVLHARALAGARPIARADLPPAVQTACPVAPKAPVEELVTADMLLRRYAMRVLASTGYNLRGTARLLGIDRKTLERQLADWGVLRPRR